MKLLKSLAILGLSSLFVVNTAQATEQKQETAQQTQKQPQKRDIALERFNQNVGIRFVSRGLQPGENNQPVVTLTYSVQNKGKNKIKSMSWISAYQVDNEVIYGYEHAVNFKPVLAPKQQVDVTISIPLAEMPEQAQKFFSSREVNIESVNGAKNVAFTNGKRIVVAKF